MSVVARLAGDLGAAPRASDRRSGHAATKATPASPLARVRRALGVSLIAVALSACDGAPPDAGTTGSAASNADVPLAAGAVETLAADADPRTLYIVANRYATGEGVPQDQDIAQRLWQVACDKGHAFACSVYGSRMIETGDFNAAATALTRAGEAGVPEAIRNLIELHDNPSWPGASVDESVRWQQVLEALQAPAQSPLPDTSG